MAFLALTVSSLYRLSSPAGVRRVPGWPWTPFAFLAMLGVTMILLVAGNPLQAALGTAIVVAGVPVYRRFFSHPTPEVGEHQTPEEH